MKQPQFSHMVEMYDSITGMGVDVSTYAWYCGWDYYKMFKFGGEISSHFPPRLNGLPVFHEARIPVSSFAFCNQLDVQNMRDK